MNASTENAGLNWLGLPARFLRPAAAAIATYASSGEPIGDLLSPVTHEPAREPTVARLGWTNGALNAHVVCHTAAMDRVRRLAREGDYSRDRWGDDAIEIQLDPGLTRERYFQIILPPTGKPVTYLGFNNRFL